MNIYETQVLKNEFFKNGYDIVEDVDFADVYVLNSCTVTASGDKKTRQILHRFKRQNPQAVIALTGCMPQAFPEDAQILNDAQVITGSSNRGALLSNIKKALQTGERIVDIAPHQKGEKFEKMSLEGVMEKTRAFVKIEDGCDRYCSYCIIPKARGPVRSKSLDDLKQEVITLVENGFKEIVLVGINLSSYGKDTGLRLIDAIELVCGIDGVCRVRLGSLEPELLLDDDIDRMAKQEKFCAQFHLSLQSGCDETLKRMNRHYDTEFYDNLVQKLRARFDDCAITTDIMVGFAGETDEEFNQTLEFAKKIKFAKAHIFAYSIRKGTRAEKFTQQIEKKVKDARSKELMKITNQTRNEFLLGYVEKTVDVLFENSKNQNGVLGHTKNYIPVYVKADDILPGEILPVKITEAYDDYCIGIVQH